MDRVESLLSKMTLEEKVGQMTQVAVDLIMEGEPYNMKLPLKIQPDKLEKVVKKYKVGSILNTPSGVYVGRKQWHEIMQAIQNTAAENRLKIPVLYGIDAIHGANYCEGATLFPQPVAMAASWNLDLAKRIAEITAYEAKSASFHWNFSPAMDIGRNPLWPRMWESFGEDVFLNEKMGLVTVEGYQGNNPAAKDKMAACLKHFTGYGLPQSGKDRTPAYIPERQLREYFLPAYEANFDAGAMTVMVCSGEINGVPVHASKRILTDILRKELGFDGIVVSDWEDVKYLYTRHLVAHDYKEAVKISVEAGIDMCMTAMDLEFADHLLALVREGAISEKRIDESVRRILRLKEQLGLFEKSVFEPNDYPDFGSEKFAAVSLQAAKESLVLLKNEKNTLPLSKNAKVLVCGPTANNLRSLNGGWTFTWQGEKADQIEKKENTILAAIQNALGAANVHYEKGADFFKEENIDAAVKAAGQADAVIICLGETSYTEQMGSFNDLDLPDAQIELAEALSKTGKPLIVVLAEGRPQVIRRIEPQAGAILGAFLPGMKGGDAIASVLFGDFNPCGKLPFTYPKYSNNLTTYDHKFTEEVLKNDLYGPYWDPQYEFGFGKSYTDFEYSNLKINEKKFSKTDKIEITVDVKNTGKMAGKEVVHLFVRDLVASVTPPVKRLRGFEKIELKPGESKTVKFQIAPSNLAFVGIDNQWVVEPGTFRVMIEKLSAEFDIE